VTEESETRVAEPDPAVFRLQAEAAWLALAPNVPAHIFRLAGIYGPGRSALDTVRKKAALSRLDSTRPGHRTDTEDTKGAGKYISRVHVSDIARVVLTSMVTPIRDGRIYNVADNEPCTRREVEEFARSLLGLGAGALTKEQCGERSAELPLGRDAVAGGLARASVRRRRVDNKRVSNRRVLSELGVQLSFPTFREGLLQIRGDEDPAQQP
jgi:nucleoside-diphosphate-sugar epimerase